MNMIQDINVIGRNTDSELDWTRNPCGEIFLPIESRPIDSVIMMPVNWLEHYAPSINKFYFQKTTIFKKDWQKNGF